MKLQDVLKVPDSQRDEKWQNEFFQAFSESNIKLLSPEPQNGPDGWPYLLCETGPDAKEPSQKVIQWLADKGIGLVVNPGKDYPDYIFSYGMLWHFTKTGLFYREVPPPKEGFYEFDPAEIQHAGTPSEDYLPKQARSILKDFFRDQGVLRPKVLLVSMDKVQYDLAISLESLGNPPEAEHQGIAEAISWFLPPHYSLLLVSEEGLPEFTDL